MVFRAPARRQHGVGNTPVAQAGAVVCQVLGQDVQAAAQRGRRPGRPIPRTRVVDERPDVVARVADHPLGVDGEPAGAHGRQHVVVVVVAVQQDTRRRRSQQRSGQADASVEDVFGSGPAPPYVARWRSKASNHSSSGRKDDNDLAAPAATTCAPPARRSGSRDRRRSGPRQPGFRPARPARAAARCALRRTPARGTRRRRHTTAKPRFPGRTRRGAHRLSAPPPCHRRGAPGDVVERQLERGPELQVPFAG